MKPEADGDAAAAIRRLIEAYAQAVDGGDPDRCAALFAPHGVLCRANDEAGRYTRRGRAEIAAAMRTLERYESTSHRIGPSQIEVADGGRHATAVTPCEAHHVELAADGSRTDKVMTIRYHDTFERGVEPSAPWRFTERCLHVDGEELREVRAGAPPQDGTELQ